MRAGSEVAQQRSGIARIAVSATLIGSAQGQDAGSRRCRRRAVWTSRPGIVKTFAAQGRGGRPLQVVNSASCEPGVGRTRLTISRTGRAALPLNATKSISATSAPETSGELSQYGIGVQASSSMRPIAARIRLSCRAVTEKRTSNLTAVSSTARPGAPRCTTSSRARCCPS